MKKMKTKLSLLTLSLILLFAYACKKDEEDHQDIKTKTEMVEEVLEGIRLETSQLLGYTVPSMNLYIQTSDYHLFASSRAEGVPEVTENTFFRFASNTKTFTSTAILNMHEDGWLDIEDLIIDTVPGLEITYVPDDENWAIPYKDQITIELLLQNASGVYDNDNDTVPNCMGLSYVSYMFHLDSSYQFTFDELIGVNAQYQLSYFPPGEGYHYSNTGFGILAYIVGRVYSQHAGEEKTFNDYLHDYVYGPDAPIPLDMHFPYLATDVDLPIPHITGQTNSPQGFLHWGRTNVSPHVGEGNGYSNFVSLNRFIRSLLKGENVLEPATVDMMMHDHSAHTDGYALGCLHATNLGYGHNGCIRGYFSLMVYDPDYDISLIACVPNVDETSWDAFEKSFLSMYYAAWDAREVLGYPGSPPE